MPDETKPPPKLTAHQIRAIAVKARRDPRAVKNAYAGRSKPGMVFDDIVFAARELGFFLPPGAEPQTSNVIDLASRRRGPT